MSAFFANRCGAAAVSAGLLAAAVICCLPGRSAADEVAAGASVNAAGDTSGQANASAASEVSAEAPQAGGTSSTARSTGFEAGLRVGAGIPMGNVGRDIAGTERKLEDLTAWRAPFWVDTGYRFSEALTVGLYFQIGVGGTGDVCAGACDWSDVRAGAHVQWRPLGASGVVPWLGAGVGYESLEFRTVLSEEVDNPDAEGTQFFSLRVSETLSGPELLLEGGLDFEVEPSLWIGPYASANLGQYTSDSYDCDPDGAACPRGSFEGSGFHSWLSVGLRGAYAP